MVGAVASAYRLTVRSQDPDPRATAIEASAAALGVPVGGAVDVADVIFVEGEDGVLDAGQLDRLGDFLIDPLLQTGTWESPPDRRRPHNVEITLHPGVTDVAAAAVLRASERLGVPLAAAATGRRIEFPSTIDAGTTELLLRRVLANPVVERWTYGSATPAWHPGGQAPTTAAPEVPVRDLDAAGLARLGADRALALDIEELEVIRDHFRREGREPTDVELETLAQTWSEHCAHKTFRATIVVDGDERPSLLDRLRAATDAVDAPFVRSAFAGNAGIVSFAEGTTLALKAETHNHPSAVEPFGGANTGVGGVIRDVMGAGHDPLAVTDVLCFGPPDLPVDELPDGALHPRRIREGVVAGVADYGNKIGLPTVAGAVLYDPGFTTNPLVFCGCIGVAPDRPLPRGPFPGDRVVVLGGRTGRDGIRGATFSSAAMDATTGEVAGASVQIGDPVTEKLLVDVLAGADGLWTAITDCGAGGLSSAVGEMADGVGAEVDLALVPLKYPGLEPWEIWLSEAQERMVVAVDPERLPALQARCARHGVELTDLGQFTGDGRLVVRHGDAVVADLTTDFLHHGRPRRRMAAELHGPGARARTASGHRPGADASRVARPPQHRVQGDDDPPLRPRDRRGDGGAAARRRAPGRAGRRCRDRRPARHPRVRRRDRRQPVVRAARSGGDGPRRRRRGDPQRRRRRCRSGPGRPARQLLLGRPPPPGHARRVGRRRRRLPRRRRGPPGAVRLGQGLAEQRVHRRRRPPARGAADARHHRRRPRPRRRALRDPGARGGRRRRRRRRRHAGGVRRQPSRPRRR